MGNNLILIRYLQFLFLGSYFLFISNSQAYEYVLDLQLGDKYLTEYSYSPNVSQSFKSSIRFHSVERSYYSYFPEKLHKNMPVLVALHGAGRTGASMIDTWRHLAEKYSFIIIAPNSIKRKWNLNRDQHSFIQTIIYKELNQRSIKSRPIYLFGHSNGAKLALLLKTQRPDKYRAVVAHAGTLPKSFIIKRKIDPRKAQVALFLGDSDQIFSVPSARKTAQWLASKGINSILYILKDHTHWYYHDAYRINEAAWKFLKQI